MLLTLCIAGLGILAAGSPATSEGLLLVPKWVSNAVNAPDRSAADRRLDAGRKPKQTLAFFEIKPGMRVAELGAGTGYTSELLARVVGPRGVVYGHNPPFVLKRFAEKPWSARLKKAVMRPVRRLDRPFDDPFPRSVKNLDVVLNVLFYHDTVWQKVDRKRMNRAIFRALKAGGVYGIVDHNAKRGHGTRDVKTLHRIERRTLIAELTSVGFRLVREGHFLRNPKDKRDWNAAPRASGSRRGTSDRFVLLFKKP